jgi:N4-(beta-N-acetylglucosaminyl)-L-asparaginase
MATTRREFLAKSAITAAGAGLITQAAEGRADTTAEAVKRMTPPKKPVIVTRVTNDSTVEEAWQMLADGTDTLEAAHHVCLGRENDPGDHSVGYGGMPNEDGVVELDASCMHGPTRRAGSVGAVRNIRNVCLVARKVMERTGHVMLVGEGAERFAVAQGFKREDLLTDDARKAWLLWKESNSERDFWGPGLSSPEWKDPNADKPAPQPHMHAELSGPAFSGPIPRNPGPEWAPVIRARTQRLMAMAADIGIAPEKRHEAVRQVLWPTTGTIHVSALNTKGEISGATTTSGQAWKLAGRLGDSPIIGAGCYTDQDVGSAGATGSGEENIRVAGAHTIVEMMRAGRSPKEAGLEALRRIVRNYDGDMKRVRYLDMIYYILRSDGAYAGVSLWSTNPYGKRINFVVHDGTKRVEECAYLLEGSYLSWPPS